MEDTLYGNGMGVKAVLNPNQMKDGKDDRVRNVNKLLFLDDCSYIP
jgi:hypothetical protein